MTWPRCSKKHSGMLSPRVRHDGGDRDDGARQALRPHVGIARLLAGAARGPGGRLVEYLCRPRYLPAVKLWGVAPTDSNPLPANAWLFGQDVVAPHSHTVLPAAQFDQLQHTA